MPDTKYKEAVTFPDSITNYFFPFLYIFSIRAVTKNPPKILIAASKIPKNPDHIEMLELAEFETATATNAPTIITDEIALVTDIKGVCNAGVTLQTT
jgi:hypothetical protein